MVDATSIESFLVDVCDALQGFSLLFPIQYTWSQQKFVPLLRSVVRTLAPSGITSSEDDRPSPLSGMIVVYLVLGLVSDSDITCMVILLIGLFNITALYYRIKSISQFNRRLLPAFGDVVVFVRLVVATLPLRLLLLALSLIFAYFVELFFPITIVSFWGSATHNVTLDLTVQVVTGKVFMLAWNMFTRATVEKRRRTVTSILCDLIFLTGAFKYGSYVTALVLPCLNGIGFLMASFAHFSAAVTVCNLISLRLGALCLSPAFFISQRFLIEAFLPAGFYVIHKLVHEPRFFGLIHFNHHLQNFPDWIDGIGEGPEEVWTMTPSFQFWLPPCIIPPFFWTVLVSIADGHVHVFAAHENAHISSSSLISSKYSSDQLGFYDESATMHFFHHLSITLSLSAPGGGEIYRDTQARTKAIRDSVNPLNLHEAEARWRQKMGFATTVRGQ